MTSQNLSLEQATPDQYVAIYSIMALAGEHMLRALGLDHWHPFPPSTNFIERMMKHDTYAVYSGNVLVGTFGLSDHPESYYLEDMSNYWADPAAEAIYFTAFGLLPGYQQQGIGTWSFSEMEKLAQARGHNLIRFDAVATHEKLLGFYDRLGCERRGTLKVGKQTVMLYEKSL